MKKIVTEVVTSLKKLPSPEKRGQTFWDYLKSQLYSESTWDQDDLKVIEKEIDNRLNKIDKKDLAEMWKNTNKGLERLDVGEKTSTKEMKADLTDELVGQVMDRMDDNYTSRDSFYSESAILVPPTQEKQEKDEKEFDEEVEPEDINDEEIKLEDEDLFDEDELDDESTRF